MTVSAGHAPAHHSSTGRPAVNRVSKSQRHRLAWALVKLTEQGCGPRLTHREARAVVDAHALLGESPDEINAYLFATYRVDPVGVTAVRNVTRERGF